MLTLQQVGNDETLRPPSITDDISEYQWSTNPMRFALDLFAKWFHDQGYDVFLSIREPNLVAMKNTRRNYIAFKR